MLDIVDIMNIILTAWLAMAGAILALVFSCKQYIKTLHLSYKRALLDDFKFLPYNGGFAFPDPWYKGQKSLFDDF